MSQTFDLDAAAQAVTTVVSNVSDYQLDRPTPCPDYTVADLLFHLLGLTAAFKGAADKDFGPATSAVPGGAETVLPDNWRDQIPRQLDELAVSWRNPAAWEGMTQAGGVDLPAEIAAQVAVNELTMHGWDIARATGQNYALDDQTLQVSFDLLYPGDDQSEREPIFGPVVEVPGDAPLLDRVIGLGGRDPHWTPR